MATGSVNFSPWLGDAESLTLTTPDSLGFTSSKGDSYDVTASTTGAGSPNLNIKQIANLPTPWTVAPGGTILFLGDGGNVTINGESGPGFDTDAFTINNAAVTFAANDAFNGAQVQFIGNSARTISAKGTVNLFDVSAWTGAGTLIDPALTNTVTTVRASKTFGRHRDQYSHRLRAH